MNDEWGVWIVKRRFLFLTLVIFALQCSRDASPVQPSMQTSSSASAIEKETFDLVNAYRISLGLKALVWNNVIAEQARMHSRDMAAGTATVGHDGFDARAEAIGQSIAWVGVGENVAYLRGYDDPAAKAVDGWLKSEGHRKNIIGDFNLGGMGVAVNDRGEYYFTQIFVKTR